MDPIELNDVREPREMALYCEIAALSGGLDDGGVGKKISGGGRFIGGGGTYVGGDGKYIGCCGKFDDRGDTNGLGLDQENTEGWVCCENSEIGVDVRQVVGIAEKLERAVAS